jgi:hypothetical protein
MCSFALQAHTVDDFFFQQKDCVQEKLYLTLDRPRYEAGDTIWFRGTLVAADNLSYLIKSNYIYVEWIDEYGTVLLRRKVRREGLCFQHNIPLEKTLSTGVYTLRAYTSWMRNFGEAQFFSAQVPITNVELPAERYAPQSYDVEVSFLPEGGNSQFILRNVKLGGWSRADALQRLYSEDVVSIDLVDRGGKFVIVTFRPGTEISDRLPNRRAFSFYGYGYNPPEYFYHPRYETQESREEWMPDLRKTLYWEPSLQSDAAGKIRLSFYTSDHSLSRRLILGEGVTFDGNAVSVWCSDES